MTNPISGAIAFGNVPVGLFLPQDIIIKNNGPGPDSINPMPSNANGSLDFFLFRASSPTAAAPSCLDNNGGPVLIAAGNSCTLGIAFGPTHFGTRTTTMTVRDTPGNADQFPMSLSGNGDAGYYVAGGSAEFTNFGDAADLNGAAMNLNAPVVGMSGKHDGGGFWMVASDGGVFTAGDTGFFGSMGAHHLNKPMVGMASTQGDDGYWLVGSDGGIFTFGTAGFFGSTGAMHLNKPVVGMAATPDNRGYWLVASDGGIFTFGTAGFFGSMGAHPLNKRVVGMASTPTGRGYWLVASDGGIFTFGDAVFFGSTGAMHLNQPIVGMAASPTGRGYWLIAADGGIFTFGDAPFEDSLPGVGIQTNDVIGMAPTTDLLSPDLVSAPASLRSRSVRAATAISGRLHAPTSSAAGFRR